MSETDIEHENVPIWTNFYSKSTGPILAGKQGKHNSDLIAHLSLTGPNTIHGCVKNVAEKKPSSAGFNETSRRIQYDKSLREYLLPTGYVIQTASTSNSLSGKQKKQAKLYTLTLKGCIFALGYKFNDAELKSFITSMSKNHLFFAYVNAILKETSISFVKEIFISPIQEIIKKGRIILDDDISFSPNKITPVLNSEGEQYVALDYDIGFAFSDIAQACAAALYKKLFGILANPRINDFEWRNVEVVKNNTYYYEKPSEDWEHAVIEKFHPTKEEQGFYYDYRDDLDARFLYKIMKDIHFAYFGAHAMGYPKYTNKLQRSKSWKLDKKYKRSGLA